MPQLVRRTLLVCLALLAAAVAPAAAEVRSGTAADPAGDAADARYDIRSVTAAYDASAGSLSVAVTLAGPPSGDGTVYAIAGTPSGTSCDAPTLALGASTDPALPTAVAVPDADGSRQRAATRTISGNVLTIRASDPAFAGRPFACVLVEIGAGGATADALDGTLPLVAAAAPPASVPLTRAQKLARALRACRAKAGPARTRCVAEARRRFGTPAAGGAPAADPRAPLAGRVYYFPGADPGFICGGVCWQGYAFVDRNWAYTEVRDTNGPFPRCPAAGAACTRYTFNPSTRRGTIGGTPFTASAGLRSITPRGGVERFRGGVFRPGARTALHLKGIVTEGSPFLAQTVITTWLELAADGRFILTTLRLGSVGSADTALERHWATVPPDARGRYAFLPGGRLRLTYENGQVSVETAFALNPDPGRAAAKGMYLGGVLYARDE
ncbi:MAG: hypothetical protein U0237_07740 [Thermoleophilia bacterium]